MRLPSRRVDPPAAVVSLAVALLGAFGLLESWGLTADDVALIVGAAMSAAATARAVIEGRGS